MPEETRKACTVAAHREESAGHKRPGWSKVLMAIYVTDNPTWYPSDYKQLQS